MPKKELLVHRAYGQKLDISERKVQKLTRGSMGYLAKIPDTLQPEIAVYGLGAMYE